MSYGFDRNYSYAQVWRESDRARGITPEMEERRARESWRRYYEYLEKQKLKPPAPTKLQDDDWMFGQ